MCVCVFPPVVCSDHLHTAGILQILPHLWVFAQVRNLQVFPSYGWELLGAGLLTLLILQTKPRIYLLPDEQVGEASPWSLGLC